MMEYHLKEVAKTFNVIRVYNQNLWKNHEDFLDLCWQYNIMVILAFPMSLSSYADLTDKDTVKTLEKNFRLMIRRHKRHPAILMWAIANEPNTASNFQSQLSSYFDVVNSLATIRDEEESASGYKKHPILIPMADSDFATSVTTYDTGSFDVWGVQPYRGSSFGALFEEYVSSKPLLVSEFGLDAYYDTGIPVYCLSFGSTSMVEGSKLQSSVLVDLAYELDSENSLRSGNKYFVAGLVRLGNGGFDTMAGFGMVEYDSFLRKVVYTFVSFDIASGTVTWNFANGAVALTFAPQVSIGATFATDSPLSTASATMSDAAVTQLLSGVTPLVMGTTASGDTRNGTGTLSFVRNSLPSLNVTLAPSTDAKQTSTTYLGRVYFWYQSAGNGFYRVDFLVLHNIKWLLDPTNGKIQSIAVHSSTFNGLPTTSSLLMILYCNEDVPNTPNNTVTCNAVQYTNKYSNVTAGNAVYRSLLPLNASMVVDSDTLSALTSGSSFVVLYMANNLKYGAMRGSIGKSHVPSVLGGLVFEWMDEWWKAPTSDSVHTGCSKDDNAMKQSTCGFTQSSSANSDLTTDRRLNEEWFGMYQQIYPNNESEWISSHNFTLRPRDAITHLWASGWARGNTTPTEIEVYYTYYIWEYATFQFLLILIASLIALTLICIAGSAAQRKRALNLQETNLVETITLRSPGAMGPVGRTHSRSGGVFMPHYRSMEEFTFQFTCFTLRQLSDGLDRDLLVSEEVLPTLLRLGNGSPVPLDTLQRAMQWDGRYADRHGPLKKFLEGYPALLNITTINDQANAKAKESPAGSDLVDDAGWTLIAETYLGLLRQQLSREARLGGEVLCWDYGEGIQTAFETFSEEAMDAAAERLFLLSCPHSDPIGGWRPPGPFGEAPMFCEYAKYTIMFLVVQQFVENLRQAANFKFKLWQFLSSAFPEFDASSPMWPTLDTWGLFNERCSDSRQLLRFLLTKVDQDVFNFADVDDLFRNVLVTGSPISSIPNPIPEHTPVFSFAIPSRPFPSRKRMEEVLPSKTANLSSFFRKTYPDTVNWAAVFRLFFFIFHFHLLLYVCIILESFGASTDLSLWVISAFESVMVILRTLLVWDVMRFATPWPSLLDAAEFIISCAVLSKIVVDYINGSGGPLSPSRAEMLFGSSALDAGFLIYLGLSLALKESTRWFNKWRAGFFHWWRDIYVARMLVLFIIGLIDYIVGALLLVPAVSQVSLDMCDCFHLQGSCNIDSAGLFCPIGLVLFFFVLFLSYMMVTALLWMLCSLLWGFASGIRTGVGFVEKWSHIEEAIQRQHLEMPLYVPFLQRVVDGQTQKLPNHGPTKPNLCLLVLQQLEHMAMRDLIHINDMARYRDWDFSIGPEAVEALLIMMTSLNGHRGLLRYCYRDKFSLSERYRLPPAVQSIFSMRSISYFVPVYAEVVIYSVADLQQDGSLLHLIDLYHYEWKNFCFRSFYGAPQKEVLDNVFAGGTKLAEVFLKYRAGVVDRIRNQSAAWPNWKPFGGFGIDIGKWSFPDDPPPEVPKHWTAKGPPDAGSAPDQLRMQQLQYWCIQQVCWWATLRGQTLGKTVFGLMEMREALVDVAYHELKHFKHESYLDMDYKPPAAQARYEDVLSWLQRNRYPLFSERMLMLKDDESSSIIPNRPQQKLGAEPHDWQQLQRIAAGPALSGMKHHEAQLILCLGELAMVTFLQQFEEARQENPSVSASDVLLRKQESSSPRFRRKVVSEKEGLPMPVGLSPTKRTVREAVGLKEMPQVVLEGVPQEQPVVGNPLSPASVAQSSHYIGSLLDLTPRQLRSLHGPDLKTPELLNPTMHSSVMARRRSNCSDLDMDDPWQTKSAVVADTERYLTDNSLPDLDEPQGILLEDPWRTRSAVVMERHLSIDTSFESIPYKGKAMGGKSANPHGKHHVSIDPDVDHIDVPATFKGHRRASFASGESALPTPALSRNTSSSASPTKLGTPMEITPEDVADVFSGRSELSCNYKLAYSLYKAATKPDAQKKLEEITKAPEDISELLMKAIIRFDEALAETKRQLELRQMADELVMEKFQLLVGAQIYENQKATYKEINQCLSMWKLRHLQFMTAKDDKANPASFWIRCKDPLRFSRFMYENVGANGQLAMGDAVLAQYMVKTRVRRMWHRLKIGEGKAENQNNMILALKGEVVNIIDMNQDAYYTEGLKLPLVLPQFSSHNRLEVRHFEDLKASLLLQNAARVSKRRQRLQKLIGGDDNGVLGFREHVFTYRHSVVGRYMAIAEHSFGTVVQRFLSRPHRIRMHYGHPDMTNAFYMKKTAGVSRGSLRVNVNEDIFLGYEMVKSGLGICFNEHLFYGKGRDVEFNAASTFLKKLAQGCVMQLASRQVAELYLTELTFWQRWALFYGTISHFLTIYITDLSIFVFAYMWVCFQLAQITPVSMGSFGSSASAAWLLPLGALNALPMIIERVLEVTYLGRWDFFTSIPFFSHQNRITAAFFTLAMDTQKGAYMASGRGIGNTNTHIVDIFCYHAATNFWPALELLTLVIIYVLLGGNSLWLMWTIIAGVCYLVAPILYNPKPSLNGFTSQTFDFFKWLRSPSSQFNLSTYHHIIKIDPLTLRQKQQLFTALPPNQLEDLDVQAQFVGDWEKAAKGGAMRDNFLTYFVFNWWSYLNALDGPYNDKPHQVFRELVWHKLKGGMESIEWQELSNTWQSQGYARQWGPLRTFLAPYEAGGFINLHPSLAKCEYLTMSSGPVDEVFLYLEHLHPQRTTPIGAFLRSLFQWTIRYVFWAACPVYAYLQTDSSTGDPVRTINLWALSWVAFAVVFRVMRRINIRQIATSVFAVKGFGWLIWVFLLLETIFTGGIFWALVYFCILGIWISCAWEFCLIVWELVIRLRHKRLVNRSFARLGYLHASAMYLLGFQRIAFSALYIGLSVVWLLFILIRQFHTGWMFSDQVALRSQNDR
eukprot:GGOE01003456.1.p1 GENE.GGOE01003456.1~~GGOE01003456.1.p1  ORF type:complete len:3098 (-),score=946.50 GGOE01003456.1:364-9156(-)